MQGKPRKIPRISLHSFGRIGTFQWVMTNPNKKIRRTLNSPPGLCSIKDPRHHVFACFSGSWSGSYSARVKTLSHISIYTKENAEMPIATRPARFSDKRSSCPKDWAMAADVRLKRSRLGTQAPRSVSHGPIQAN